MKNSFGNSLSITLFGESHGEAIGAVIDGLAPGITIDEEFIAKQMDKRKAYGKISQALRQNILKLKRKYLKAFEIYSKVLREIYKLVDIGKCRVTLYRKLLLYRRSRQVIRCKKNCLFIKTC